MQCQQLFYFIKFKLMYGGFGEEFHNEWLNKSFVNKSIVNDVTFKVSIKWEKMNNGMLYK
jgi:hypothetical protein